MRAVAQQARGRGTAFGGNVTGQILRQWLTGPGGLAGPDVPFKAVPVVRPPGGGGNIGNPRYIGFGTALTDPLGRNIQSPAVTQQYRIAARSWGLSPNDPNLVPKIDALKARVLQQSPRATPSQSRAANRANQLYTLGDTLAGTFGSSYVDNPMRRISP